MSALALPLMLLIGLVVSSKAQFLNNSGIFYSAEHSMSKIKLWLSITAKYNFVEVSWQDAPVNEGDAILLTSEEPTKFVYRELPAGVPLAEFPRQQGNCSHAGCIAGNESGTHQAFNRGQMSVHAHWICEPCKKAVIAAITPLAESQWFATGVPFSYNLSRLAHANTGCYGFWASYINKEGVVLTKNCIRAFPRWMNDLRAIIGGLRFSELFIPGTHDSGSYKTALSSSRESLITKYTITQDDDIYGQLVHGVRYLDIRIGYYKRTPEKFFINHGVSRQGPLLAAIEQVKRFVQQTNELVIFGIKEFPVGFGEKLTVHRLLVSYLREHFGPAIVNASVTWSATLDEMWSRKEYVILAYDHASIVEEFPDVLFISVRQLWGNVRQWEALNDFLVQAQPRFTGLSWELYHRPVADMAELTPMPWDVLTNKFGGLRSMADSVNMQISELYRNELGHHANIVAADFIRGTTLVENAIEINKRKINYMRSFSSTPPSLYNSTSH